MQEINTHRETEMRDEDLECVNLQLQILLRLNDYLVVLCFAHG